MSAELIIPRGQEIVWEWASPKQYLAYTAPPELVLFLVGGQGSGKRCKIDTPVPTPTGWTAMGELKAGDVIFDETGRQTTVVVAHPILMAQECYRVHFNDGTSIDADGEHLWCTFDAKARKAWGRLGSSGSSKIKGPLKAGNPADWPRWRTQYGTGPEIRTTRTLFDTQLTEAGFANHSIPNAGPLELRAADLPMDPYILGAWLGNGGTNQGVITINLADCEAFEGRLSAAGFQQHVAPSGERPGCRTFSVHGLTTQLRAMGVLGNKHVPPAYLRGSIAQREAMLAGLMDTDGTVDSRQQCRVTYTSTTRALADGCLELMRSLGMRPSIREDRAILNGENYGPCWDVACRPPKQVFWCKRKADTLERALGVQAARRSASRFIESVERIPPCLMRCITVDSPNSLFLCGEGMIPTHNSLVCCRRIIDALLRYPGYRALVIRKIAKQLRDTTMVTFYAELPPQYIAKRNDNDGFCELKNGSRVSFLHLDKPDSMGALLSLEINGIFIEEALEIEERAFDAAMRRVGRWTKAHVPEAWVYDFAGPRVDPSWKWRLPNGGPLPPPLKLLASNPGDDEKHWLYRRFYDSSTDRHDKRIPEIGADRRPTGRMLSYADMGYTMIEMPSAENRFLSDGNLQLIYAAGDIDRFAEGKWGKRKGRIHTIHPDSLVPGSDAILQMVRMRCRLSRVLDHGTTAPTACGWFGNDADGNVYMVREYYVPDKLISYHREAIYVLSEGEQYAENLADPSIFAKSMRRGKDNHCTWSVADEYLDKGMYKPQTAIAWRPAENAELGTRNRINEYLAFDPDHINPFTQKRGSPRLFFIMQSPEYPHGCVHTPLETEAQRLVQEKDGSFSTDRDPTIIDHAYDCLSGDTQIFTAQGSVAIRDMPPSGVVLTPHGFRPYTDCRRYSGASELIRVTFSDGTTLVCTPDHLLLKYSRQLRYEWISAAESFGAKIRRERAVALTLGQKKRRKKYAIVIGTEAYGTGETWCLTVSDFSRSRNAFCVGTGIFVSNCVRYYIAARRPIRRAAPVFPRGSIGDDIRINERELERAKRQRESEYGL